MTIAERRRVEEAMEVLHHAPCGAVGTEGMTIAEMREAWNRGKFAGDDATYDACQHAFRLLEKALEGGR